MHTFQVTDKEILGYYRSPREHYDLGRVNQHEDLEGETVHSLGPMVMVGHKNAFFDALGTAFNAHYPVIISPDAVWLTALNGLVQHIDQDPEGLRHHFVEHEGKLTLKVQVESPPLPFVPPEVWRAGVQSFSQQLKEHIGKRHDLIVNDFSTTKQTDIISSEIMLMGAMKHYFEYKMMLMCGLTKVTVEGTVEDWESIKQRLAVFSEFGLKWWTDELIPIVDQFKSACAGNPDIEFWKRMFVKHRHGSGSQYGLEGWLCAFFPYLSGGQEMVRNPCVNWAGKGRIDPDDIPSSLAFAPVELDDHGALYDFKFYGGLVGCCVEDDFTISPVAGYFIQNLGAKERTD
jgi:hypothetical protein